MRDLSLLSYLKSLSSFWWTTLYLDAHLHSSQIHLLPLIFIIRIFKFVSYLAFSVDAHVQTPLSAPGAVLHLLGQSGHHHDRVSHVIFFHAEHLALASQGARLAVVHVRRPLVEVSLIGNAVEGPALIFPEFLGIRTGLKKRIEDFKVD